MFSAIKEAIKTLPGINRLVADRERLIAHRDRLSLELVQHQDNLLIEREQVKAEIIALKENHGFVPGGHFYSPIPDFDEIRKAEKRIFGSTPDTVPGVELNETVQLELVEKFVRYYKDMPFKSEKREGMRYFFENSAYSYSDGIFLHCMIRDLKPQRIIEVGSGFSSCVILDTNEMFFNGSIATTFIEPYPELLMSLVTDVDKSRIEVIPSRLQDVDLCEFESLQANDILFIDSTHVSKIDSDVNRIIFDILPRLTTGVYVHFHDIFFPFEYPKEWLFEGRAWNEAYLLKAFLQFNESFHIVLMSTYLQHFHQPSLRENLPLCLKNPGGSIWIRKG